MPRKCTLCRMSCKDEGALDIHVRSAHPNAFPCPFKGCKESFASRTDKEEHYCNHFPPTAAGQPPQQKPGPARQASNANAPPAQFQPAVQPPAPTRSGFPKDGFALRDPPSSSYLPRESHDTSSSPTVTSNDDDRFHCGMCLQTFLSRFSLNAHMATHIGPLVQHCKDCNSSFPSIDELGKHMRPTGSCPLVDKQGYNCKDCGKSFASQVAVQAHANSAHKPSILAQIRAITAHMPPQQQTQQMHGNTPQQLAHQGSTQSPPSPIRVRLPPTQQGRARPTPLAPLVYPIETLLRTRPAVTPSPPHHASTKPPPKHSAPANAPRRGPSRAAKRGSPKPPSEPSPEITQRLEEISSRVTDLQLPDRPKYGPEGAVLYHDKIWQGVPFGQHDTLLKALHWRCHLSIADRKTKSVPSAFDDGLSEDDQEASNFELSPVPAQGVSKQAAIGLACHKIIAEGGKNEIAHLSVLDFFTGEVLMNHLVLPDAYVENWRTRITGFNEKTISDAIEAGCCVLDGWKAARQAMWLLVDTNTVIVGYQLRETLDALRMTHGCGVDGAILVQEAAGSSLSKKQLRLETLSHDLLGRELKSGNYGRDCLEIAFAARELVIWSTKNKEKLAQWGKAKAVGGDEEAELIRKIKEELAAENEERQDSSAENEHGFT
ncbi:hypothetical protein BU16DRAFT_281216 [Lophium mytilinum]|uniref:C2H2-type domain-containing protein n=1 Tax=Lophium mytilinum TaxID=390894 RepID=A0A6A6R598_9PEZI|nr:hypothetical protein BU16DRAFT_281216 [Lophium mytilinum]